MYLALAMRRATATGQVIESAPIEESDIGRLAAALATDTSNNWSELDPLNFLLDPNRIYSYADLIDLIVKRVIRCNSPFVLHPKPDDENIGSKAADQLGEVD